MLNLGDIVFGLNADTKGLQNAVARLELFQKHVDQVTRSTTTGGQKFSRAFAAQERSIRAAIAATAQLVSELRRVGATPGEIGRATLALTNLQRTMQKGALDAVAFSRAQDKFNASATRTKRAINQLQPAAAGKRMGRFNEVMRDLESASVLAVGPLSGLGARIRAIGAIAGRSTLAIVALAVVITALIVAVVKLAKAAVEARVAVEKMQAGFLAATGSLQEARFEFDLAASIAKELGLNIKDVGQEYSKLAAATRGTSLAGKEARKIFHAVSVAAVALKLNTEETSGAFRAIQQMISKGNVQAEELRGQWGERIPGGFRLAALAIGKSTTELGKLLKAGKVVSEDLLPKLSDVLINEFSAAAAEAADSVAAATERMSTAFFQFAISVDTVTDASGFWKTTLKGMTFFWEALTNTIDDNLSLQDQYNKLTGKTADGQTAVVRTLEQMEQALNKARSDEFIKFMTELAEKTADANDAFDKARDRLSRLVEKYGPLDRAVTIQSLHVGELAAEWAKLSQWLKNGQEAYDKFLATLEEKPTEVLPEELSKATLDAIKDLDKLLVKFVDLEQVLGTIDTGGGAAAVRQLEALHEATRELIDVPDAEKSSIIKMLQFLDPLATTAEELFANLAMRIEDMEEIADRAQDRFKKLPEALKEASTELNRLLRETAATMAGPEALERFNKELERSDAIKDLRDDLEKAGANQQELNEATNQYIEALDKLSAAQIELEKVNATIKIIEKTTERAFNRIGAAITEAFVKGEAEAIQFGNIVMAVLGEIMQTLLKISLFDPLTKAFTSALTKTGPQGPTPGDIAGTPFGMGGAWDNVRKAAKGMVLGGPTLFGGIGGSKVLGGERGPEALMPLDRISGGKLGVNVEGAHPITINVHNNIGADVAVQQRQQSGGGLSVDIMIDRAVARALRRGGESAAAIPELFNVNPRVISR